VGSTWQLCVAAVQKFGLVVTHARFQKAPSSPFMTVLFDGRLGEIFVPYHPGTPRFGDISQFNFSALTLSTADCPSPHVKLGGGRICREIVDYGVAWKDDALVRRGRQILYWAVLDAANYNYIMEWAFRDDGTIVVRAGSTGPKLGGPDDTTGHFHSFTWRLDIDLAGPGGDSAYMTRHDENLGVVPSTGSDSSRLIELEGGRTWSAARFNSIEIGDSALVNDNGSPTTYELVPVRSGTARLSEAFTRSDFWVTRFAGANAQLLAVNLPAYVNGQSTIGQNNVIWYTGSAHHESNMRDEDRQTVPVLWVEFRLIPHNLFEGTPFFSR
jgi:Cu2+-containing amine oxidase